MAKVIILCLLAIVEMAAGFFMFLNRRSHNDRSRSILAIFFIFSAIGAILTILLAGNGVSDAGERPLLKPSSIFVGFTIFFFLMLYPIEIMRPNWLNVKRCLRILTPYLTFAGMYAVVNWTGTHHLYSTEEIFRNIDKSEVFLRLVLSLLFIPYGLWVMQMHYNWRKSSAPIKWLKAIVSITMLMTVTFSCSKLFQIRWTIYLHLLLYFILTAIILLMEIRVRFRVPKIPMAVSPDTDGQDSPGETPATGKESQTSGKKSQDTGGMKNTEEILKENLQKAMDNPNVWQNPNLTREMLCHILGTNANYLQKAIKSMGYASYSDLINHKRVEYVCREIETGRKRNLQDIFFQAGYRSRITAWRNFTAITGTSPALWGSDSENIS